MDEFGIILMTILILAVGLKIIEIDNELKKLKNKVNKLRGNKRVKK